MIKFQSLTGALIVLDDAKLPIAYKLGDTWYEGRYVPVGFTRTPLTAPPALSRDEAKGLLASFLSARDLSSSTLSRPDDKARALKLFADLLDAMTHGRLDLLPTEALR